MVAFGGIEGTSFGLLWICCRGLSNGGLQARVSSLLVHFVKWDFCDCGDGQCGMIAGLRCHG